MWIRVYLLAALALGACTFSTEIPPETTPTITVGFAALSSTADEKSAGHQIKVQLSAMSTSDVTVKYQIEGGTASPPADYDIVTAETITIPAGQLESVLELRVKADTDGNETDETIDLILVEPSGAQLATEAQRHAVTIRAKALPRVGFEILALSAQEPADPTIGLVLDEPSEFDITASYTMTSTNATSGVDYVLANGNVTFPAGMTTASITLDVLDDVLDEDPESVTITLTTSTNAEVDALKDTVAHTILDDQVDPPPEVFFQAATSTFSEAGGAVNVVVALSAVSGRTITVPYMVDNTSSATGGGTDFLLAATTITIPPNTMTGNIALTIVQDTINEPNEIVELDMLTATNATNAGQQSHRLQIDDDDLVCFGPPNSASDVCLDDVPTNTVTLSSTPGTIDTNIGSADCSPLTIDFGPGQDAACFIVGAAINVSGVYLVAGSRPLVLVAASTITVSGVLDASSSQGVIIKSGAGSNSAACSNGTNPQGGSGGTGGGAGGSFMGAGGSGGSGDNDGNDGGTAALADAAAPAKLRGGCAGQNGAGGGGGAGGRGGGAIYLVSGGSIDLNFNTAIINVSGAGGGGGAMQRGGGGGGSGGMIQLYAETTLAVHPSTKLVANGGGGGGGGTQGTAGTRGADPDPANEQSPALGGLGVQGGAGFAGSTNPTNGSPGGSNEGGGAGGGGGGYILSNRTLGNADRSAAVISAP